jgi:hypothetical protein
MNKRVLAGVIALALLLAGCGKLLELIDDADRLCAAEARAHTIYVTFVAPFRPADKVAKEARFYAKVEKVCTEGGTLDQIRDAIAAAKAARD